MHRDRSAPFQYCALGSSANRAAVACVREKQRLTGSRFINTRQPQTRLVLTHVTQRSCALRLPFRLPSRLPIHLQSRLLFHFPFPSTRLTVRVPILDSCMPCFAHDPIKLPSHSGTNNQ